MPHDANPMGVLVSAMSTLSVFHPDANPALRAPTIAAAGLTSIVSCISGSIKAHTDYVCKAKSWYKIKFWLLCSLSSRMIQMRKMLYLDLPLMMGFIC
ncbi:uncharacterized protein LOC131219361 isoform X3 [Magnolia sinica]|uniref:uncharacterized protein LOC131219361 isoform X3 n=1 Tax=Magnolia sinica TaxID=86752 RepID=UPI002658CDB0|nr:uncharacterized protein LOC131219361 isoform X3 [Magnolia sinica]